jgi:hypothetical protein
MHGNYRLLKGLSSALFAVSNSTPWIDYMTCLYQKAKLTKPAIEDELDEPQFALQVNDKKTSRS